MTTTNLATCPHLPLKNKVRRKDANNDAMVRQTIRPKHKLQTGAHKPICHARCTLPYAAKQHDKVKSTVGDRSGGAWTNNLPGIR